MVVFMVMVGGEGLKKYRDISMLQKAGHFYDLRLAETTAAIAPLGLLPLLSLFLMSGVLLTGCDSAPPVPLERPTAIARICRDGSYIYRYADGTYRAWNGYRVDDIEKVCDR